MPAGKCRSDPLSQGGIDFKCSSQRLLPSRMWDRAVGELLL